MNKVIAICNQKGGVGKTMTVASLGVALAREGKKVLLIDLDPQGDLSTCFGYRKPDELEHTVSTLMLKSLREEPFDEKEGIRSNDEGIDILPANLELSAMEMSLVGAMDRERALKGYVDVIRADYEYILIDCMPSLGMITINALAASDSVIIPVQAHYLPAKGMEQLMQTISRVKRYVNPQLKVEGILMTLVDGRTNFAKEVPQIIRESYGKQIRIYENQIPMRIRAAQVPAEGHSIFASDGSSDVAKAYAGLAKEVIRDGKREKAKLHAERDR